MDENMNFGMETANRSPTDGELQNSQPTGTCSLTYFPFSKLFSQT